MAKLESLGPQEGGVVVQHAERGGAAATNQAMKLDGGTGSWARGSGTDRAPRRPLEGVKDTGLESTDPDRVDWHDSRPGRGGVECRGERAKAHATKARAVEEARRQDSKGVRVVGEASVTLSAGDVAERRGV
jgi:hypothetical protein